MRFSFVQVALQKVQDLKDPLPTLWLWHHKREDTSDRCKQVDVGNRPKGEVIFWHCDSSSSVFWPFNFLLLQVI